MNTNNNVKSVRSDNVLENLDGAVKSLIIEVGQDQGVKKAVEFAENLLDVPVSEPTMCRFLKRQRELSLIEDGDEVGANAEKLAGRGKGESMRKGALEALRQRMFEEAVSAGTETAAALYDKMVREERELRELALAERKAAQVDEGLQLQRERLRLDEVKAVLELLPKIREALMEGTTSAEERVARARELLTGGGKLLAEGKVIEQ